MGMAIDINRFVTPAGPRCAKQTAEQERFEITYANLFATHGTDMDARAVAQTLELTREEVLKAVRCAVSEDGSETGEAPQWARLLAYRHARVGHKFLFQTSAVARILASGQSVKGTLPC